MHSLKSRFLSLITALTLLFFSSISLAQTPVEPQTQAVAESRVEIGQSVPKAGDYFVEIFFSLILVLGIIFVSAWMLRRFGRFPGVADGNLRVLGALSVGQRERIMLLQVGEEQILVGVTSSKISKLHKLETPVDFPEIQAKTFAGLGAKKKKSEDSSSFAQNLQDALQSSKKRKTPESDEILTNQPAGNLSNSSQTHIKERE